MANPDITVYTDLTINNKTPQDIVTSAVATLQSRFPEWTPSLTNLEMALMEALAVEVSEAIYIINTIPSNIVEMLLTLFGTSRGQGTAPSVSVQFTMSDTAGYIIPAGTEVSIPIGLPDNLSFFTNTPLTITAGTMTGTVTATAVTPTISANGVASGTACQLLIGLPNVTSVATASVISGGVDPELTSSWLNRGIQLLQRLSSTLVTPAHFTSYALTQPYVNRANAIDNFNISFGSGSPGDHPGHISVLVYGFGDVVSSPNKATLLAAMQASSMSNLGIHLADPTITTINVTCTVKGNTSYTSAQTLADVTAALQAYLNPNSWQWSGVVRYNDLVKIISNVPSVAYLVSLTTPSTDVTIGLNTVLVNAGTLSITVS